MKVSCKLSSAFSISCKGCAFYETGELSLYLLMLSFYSHRCLPPTRFPSIFQSSMVFIMCFLCLLMWPKYITCFFISFTNYLFIHGLSKISACGWYLSIKYDALFCISTFRFHLHKLLPVLLCIQISVTSVQLSNCLFTPTQKSFTNLEN